ncbi:psuG [Symbiodinium sp. CCMP2592]|nr:psuG [Symbiodinium sp. CCMP2592]
MVVDAPLLLSDEVRVALADGRPVVALESTIISHGMPYPQNLQTAKDVEAVLRDRGVVPATIGILKGRVHVGMDAGQLEALAKLGLECRKVSRRDIAAVLAKRQDGATTVSATMIFADKAGIPIFVTGGIGGVHRGADATWDVSADLTELGRTAVCVVCAGAKSILDLPRTLEFLETQGVCVAGYRTSDFPAFFTPRSGLTTSCSVDGPEEAAEVLAQQLQACLGSGMVLAVPVPESLAAEGARVEEATRTAVEESTKLDIRGNEVTPFLLKRINELTGGRSGCGARAREAKATLPTLTEGGVLLLGEKAVSCFEQWNVFLAVDLLSGRHVALSGLGPASLDGAFAGAITTCQRLIVLRFGSKFEGKLPVHRSCEEDSPDDTGESVASSADQSLQPGQKPVSLDLDTQPLVECLDALMPAGSSRLQGPFCRSRHGFVIAVKCGAKIRVHIRVRPPTEREIAVGSAQAVFVDGSSVIIKSDPPRSFAFDGVLGESSTQQDVFESLGRMVGSSCLAGYNGSVYVYGQTGAGKTHTMCGPITSVQSMQFDERRGIICRMLDYVFSEVARRGTEDSGVEHSCRCSFLEIYKEQITDLLEPANTNLQVREDMNRGVYVERLSEVTVGSLTEAFQAMFLQSCCGILQDGRRSHRAPLSGRLTGRGGKRSGDDQRGSERRFSAESKDPAGPSQPLLGENPSAETSWLNQVSNQVTEAWGIYGDADLMPYRKKILQKSPSMVATGQRGAVRAAEESLSTGDQPPAAEPGEELVTEENIMLSLRVVRGKEWQHGDEDGGPGFVGIVLSFDTKRLTAQVLWERTCQAHSHYRYGTRYGKGSDLAVFKPALGVTPSLGRRNSQEFFATKFQTMIVLDWDDSLFPTSYLRDELRLSWMKAWKDQNLPAKLKDEVASKLAICQTKVVDLLKQTTDAGKVILVTLARKPWVLDSCRNFFPTVGQAITELNVPVIYAQDGAGVDYNKVHMSSNAELERFWSGMKARAIARECREFYSQYDGQSWKNVISIGDSDFERLGTMLATKDYMAQTGIQRADNSDNCAVVDDHVYKVRTKTLKMVDQPSIDELNTQLGLLRTWLPLMAWGSERSECADKRDHVIVQGRVNEVGTAGVQGRRFFCAILWAETRRRHATWGGVEQVTVEAKGLLCLARLKFAARAKHIRCTVVRNEAFSGTVESLMEEVQMLRNKLAQLSGRSFDRTPLQSQLSPGSISEGVEEEPEAEDVGFAAVTNDLEEEQSSLSDRQRIARLEVLLSAALEREASAEQRRFRLKRLATFLEDLDFRKCHRLRKLHAEYVSQLAPQVEGSAIADDMEVRELSAKLKSFGHLLGNLTRGARLEDGDYGYGAGMDSDTQSTEASSGMPMESVEDQAAISGDEAKFIREENRMLRRQLENHPEVQRMIAENWALREELRALDPTGWPRVPGQPSPAGASQPHGSGDGENKVLPSPPSISSEVLAGVEADDESSSKTWFYFQKMAKEVEELMRAKESLSRAIERTQREPGGASQGLSSEVQSLMSQPAKEASGAVPVSSVVELDIATQEALKQAQGLLQGPGCARLPAVTAAGAAGRRGAKEVDDGRSPERGFAPPEQVGAVPCDDEERFKQAVQRIQQLQGTVDLVSAAYGDAFDEFQRLREEYESRLEECQFFELQCSRLNLTCLDLAERLSGGKSAMRPRPGFSTTGLWHSQSAVERQKRSFSMSSLRDATFWQQRFEELRELTGADPLPEDLSVTEMPARSSESLQGSTPWMLGDIDSGRGRQHVRS